MDPIILLNEVQAARFLGVQPKTLSAWRYRGIGPIFRKVGRLVKYVQSDLEDYLATQARTSTSDNRPDRRQDRNPVKPELLT